MKYRPPLVGAAALHSLRVVAGRSSAAPRAASLGDWDEFPCPVSLGHDLERREPPGAMGAVLPKLAAALLQLEEGGRSRFIEGAGVASLSDDSILLQVATEWQEGVRMSGTWPTTTTLRQRRSRHGFADMIVDLTAMPSSAQTLQADRPVENWRCGSSRRLRASPVC